MSKSLASTLHVIVVALAMTSCGEPSFGPVSPTPHVPPVSPYPNMVGNWSGTLTTEMVTTPIGPRTNDLCNETWRVTTQTAGEFTGTFETSGGIVTRCAESGTMSGTVSPEGVISGLAFSVMAVGQILPGPPADVVAPRACARVSGDGRYTGELVDGRSLTAEAAERTVCVGVTYVYLQFDRTFRLSMSKHPRE